MIITNTLLARPSKQEDLRAWRTCLLLPYEMWWKGAISVTKTPLIESQISGWEKITNIAVTKNKCRFEGSLPPISPSREATQSSPTLIRGLNHHIASHHNIILFHQMNCHYIIFLHKVSSKLHYLYFGRPSAYHICNTKSSNNHNEWLSW